MIWEKAQQLYQEDQESALGSDFKGITATKAERREGGYLNQAKILVLRDLWRQTKGLVPSEEDEAIRALKTSFFADER